MDWSNLRTWDGSQTRAFELLCGQLAAAELVPVGSTLMPKASPDAGVECYWRLPNRDEWAWQAKFFRDPPGDSQWKQMDKSVIVALEKHPRLTRYTFCLPRDREDPRVPEQQWFMNKWDTHTDKWKILAQQRGIEVEFPYWGESEILNRLSQETHAGRLYFWFNSEYLHRQWFEQHIEVTKSNAGPRYSPELSIDLPIASLFDGLSRMPDFVPRNLKSVGRQLFRAWQRANRAEWRDFAADEFSSLENSVQELAGLLDGLQDTGVLPLPLSRLHELASQADKVSSACVYQLDVAAQSAQQEEERAGTLGDPSTSRNVTKSENLRSGGYYVTKIVRILVDLVEFIESAEARLANVPSLLLVGDAGTGKTHLFCDVAERRIKDGLPTIVLLGEQFNNDEPWAQIIKLLGLSCSRKEELLGALEAAAQCVGSRALILIDALNEGEGKNLWQKHLAGILSTLAGYSWVGVAVSVRTSYEPIVIPAHLLDEDHLIRCMHEGFSDVEYDATQKFFEYYRIQSPTVPFLTPEFRNPQFLKLFCEGLHRKGLTTIPEGLEGITSIIDFFLSSTDDKLWKPDNLDYDPESRLVQRAVDEIAKQLAETRRSWMPRDEAKKFIDELLPGRGYERSLFGQMLSEGILAADMYYVGRDKPPIEGIHFVYERLTDHLVASYLLGKHLDLKDPSSAFLSGQPLGELIIDETAAWTNRGLVEAFCIQIPEKTGRELHELAPHCSDFWAVQEAFIQSLVWRKPDTIQQAAIDFINSHIIKSEKGHDKLYDALLTVAPRSDHPLNARFLHRNLLRENLPERDAHWSIFLHEQYGTNGIIDRLIDWAWLAKDKEHADDESVFLTSLTLVWFFTSSNRSVRDRATKALVSLLEFRLHVLMAIINEFSGVNDPYVSERIFAAAYGCSLRSNNVRAIGELAQGVYDMVFREGTPPPNVLLRDYARGVVENATHRGCSMQVNLEKIRPPYQSDWTEDIPTEAELHEEYYPKDLTKESGYIAIWSSVMSFGDFARYIIGTNSGGFEWSSRRLNVEYGPSRREQYEDFIASLTERQGKAFSVYETVRRNAEYYIRIDDDRKIEVFKRKYSEEELAATTQEALHRLNITLGKSKRQKLKDMVLPYLEDRRDETAFDLSLAQRWIFKKAVDLGWRPEIFGDFDRYVNYRDVRESHKSERIGKKYQWIAYYEFLARVSDNFRWVERWDSTKYEGPWQLYGRNIDPSVVLPTTGYQPYDDEVHNWWFPVEYEAWNFHQEDTDWLRAFDDLPNLELLLDVRAPEDSSEWLLLEGIIKWEEPVLIGEDKYETSRKDIWYMIKSYIVNKEDAEEIYEWATKQNFMGRWMPESHDVYRMFLGEYPWASSVQIDEEWTQGRDSVIPRPVLVSADRYVWEGSGYDCSLDDTMSIQLPCAWLIRQMGLNWNGEEGYFRDNEGTVIAFDPSVKSKGPSVLLANKKLLLEFLEQNGYSLVWTVLGQKNILGPTTNRGEWKGQLEISGVASIRNGLWEIKINPDFRTPDRET